jgi:predicted AAA+ superfamily ATPase
MDIRFQPNNSHLDDAASFAKTDPHLKRLYVHKYVYQSALLDELPTQIPGILTLGGGRQVGKTTLLKQWMERLLRSGVAPEAICFFSGELIRDNQTLYSVMKSQLDRMPAAGLKYFILDEVTDIDHWDKTIKYLADTGALSEVVLVLSGSDSVLIQEARKRFPGRRGKSSKVDFHYYPLSFREFLQLKNKLPIVDADESVSEIVLADLYRELNEYLIHGGFLTAINEFSSTHRIDQATLSIYSDWIRGDVLKRDKREHYLKDIIEAIVKHYMKQVSWDNLVQELSIDHTQTVADYMGVLESMDAVFVQAAIIEDKLKPAPKKRKKLMFCDPFIFHAMRAWIDPVKDPYQEQILAVIADPEGCSDLIEACVVTHFRRFFPTYYIKADGEVDVAYVHQKKCWPVEVKWTKQLRPKDLKQICKYKNGYIYAKTNVVTKIQDIPVLPLPLALLRVDLLGL